MAPQTVTLATHNQHKVEEIQLLLKSTGWQIAGMGDMPAPVEDGGTFEANALIKAIAATRATDGWALADDSGLCVDALDGAPGVDTAYYGGYPKLLEAMVNITKRTAHFVCVIVLTGPQGEHFVFKGTCAGSIASTARGNGTFGYDPVFIPEGDTRTFAEMTPDEKHAFSHRGRAIRTLLEWQKTHDF